MPVPRSATLGDLNFAACENGEGNPTGDRVVAAFVCPNKNWLKFVSKSEEMEKFAEEELGKTFALGVCYCQEETVPCEMEGYTLSCVTCSSPSTMFTMKRGDKTVAKALCTYQNSEMDTVGPTVDMVEVTKEWRKQGLGKALMKAAQVCYSGKFEEAMVHEDVTLSICIVTTDSGFGLFKCLEFEVVGIGDFEKDAF